MNKSPQIKLQTFLPQNGEYDKPFYHKMESMTNLSTTRWRVRASALLRIIENYSYIMELWNECLVNENLTTEIKSQVIGCQI